MQTLLYNLLISASWFQKYRILCELWYAAWNASCSAFSARVRTTIHGRRVAVNFGYPYPWIARSFRAFNNPLIELVYQTFQSKGKSLCIVDVGASVGDTVLMLEANCPGMIGPIYCIEADAEYFAYLKHNLSYRAQTEFFNVFLSSDAAGVPSLVRTHPGTASARGSSLEHSTTLDELLSHAGPIDVIKIDVDGFDGKVLQGAGGLLQRSMPNVIFEWHPKHCRNTGNDWQSHFAQLSKCGYSHFVFYTKYGVFNHLMRGYDRKSIDQLAHDCLTSAIDADMHYDVIALAGSTALSIEALADCGFAYQKQSPF